MLARFKSTSSIKTVIRAYSTQIQQENEYTDTPNYPPILDLSRVKDKERKTTTYHEEIKGVKTVEEKQIKLNMPRYYGFKCYLLKENEIPYDNLKMTQFVTKTFLFPDHQHPDYYNNVNIPDTTQLKSLIEDALLLELNGYEKWFETNKDAEKNQVDNWIGLAIVKTINRILSNTLSPTYPHLKNTILDIEPRVESTWYCGGIKPPRNIIRWRKALEYYKANPEEPVNRLMNYQGTPLLQLRSQLPLPPLLEGEEENESFEVPEFRYDPRTVGTHTEHRRFINLPGFFAGDSNRFGLISYHPRGHMLLRTYEDHRDPLEALQRQAILASFGWLTAQANHLGFNTYNDVTYPLVNQCVITNGKEWTFSSYQLNTMRVHLTHTIENKKRNFCWVSQPMQLYGDVVDGRLVDLNEDVLKVLLKFYSNTPRDRNVDLTPYLSSEEKLAADYQDPEKRTWLEREYKHLTSNRPLHRLPYEIYLWEKIYKIDHNKRPMDPRRRPFELYQHPWSRRLDERQPAYIPRKYRPDVKRSVGRWAKEFFP